MNRIQIATARRVLPWWLYVLAICCLPAVTVFAENVPPFDRSAETASECQALADMIADTCPQRCTRKHCSQRCIPPLNEDGLCGRCQDRCAQICESQADLRRASCPTKAPADMAPSEIPLEE